MSPAPSEDQQHDFRTRVLPLLTSAVIWRDTDELHRRGWFFEALDQSGFRVIGHRDEPSIRWDLLNDGVQITTQPGGAVWMPTWMVDAALAEKLVSTWWAAVMS